MNDRLFGISLRGESECAAWLDGLPGFCRVLEVPGAALDPRRLRGEVAAVCAERGIEWGVRDLLDADLARQLIRSGDALRIEACGKFEERALAAVAAGARWASLDLDAGRAAVDPDYETALHGLLRQFVGALSRLNAELPLLLPVRIPAPETAEPERLLRLRHQLPLPGVRLEFELHPHEPGALTWSGVETLRFEARFWRICFVPESGNTLAPAALHRFLAATGTAAPEPLRIFFSPEGTGAADDYTLKQLADTAEKWKDLP